MAACWGYGYPTLATEARLSAGEIIGLEPKWLRPGWPNVIQCNTQDGVSVTREVIKEFFAKALENKGLACDLDVNCRFDTDKKFSVAFNAPGNVGQECAKALLRTKKANGEWQTFHVLSPSGAQV